MKALLEDLLPPKARQVIYLIVALGALGFSVWSGSEGDWLVFVGGMFTSLASTLAAGNVPSTPTVEEGP